MNSRHRAGASSGDNRPDTTINLPEDYVAQEKNQLKQFHRDVDDYLNQAAETMSKLKDQRDMLRRGKSILQDINNQLGLSGTVMRLIERRGRTDMYIFWFLVVVFFLFVIIIIYWSRS